MSKNINKVSAAGLLIALGIIYGDIGTSPLYVFNAIITNRVISEELIIGALSCIIWTITLQTTVKYVLLVLNADNKGEGGTFALYALVRRRKKWLVIPAMIGGAALLADGIITPPISVTSAIEGLKELPAMRNIASNTIVIIVIAILAAIFFMQQFGTASIGKLFGPIMFIWFTMLAILGIWNMGNDLSVFKALNPYYGIKLLTLYPNGFWLLGAVFLCTTGAEALYSDLGHCGRKNIRLSWIYVKACLLLNYFGQGALLLSSHKGLMVNAANKAQFGINAFYDLMPQWFIIFGVIIATSAAIIASQAMISGSFTLISEALRLNLWPKMKVRYPSEERGQLFVPGINLLLFVGCIGIVLYFRESSRMEAAYGLAIVVTMLSTTILYSNFLVLKRTASIWIYIFLFGYLVYESAFLIALMEKFVHGGYVTLLVGGALFAVMYVWYRSRKIKNRYVEFVRLENYIPMIQELSNDKSIPKYATHLVYMTSANNHNEIEHKIIYSILNKKPKRADIYWFVHVDVLDDPYTCEYNVEHIIPNDIIRIEFRLGFRVEHRINLMFRRVVEELVKNKEVNITSRYESLEKNNIVGDFQFIVLEKYLSQDNELPFFERIVMKLYFWLKEISLSEERGFGLDPSNVTIEKFPLIVAPVANMKLSRVFPEGEE
ncbi:KUP/HAK/KT family potassium transporter [Sediminibacterium sp.]|uniref:KUP/HAK/KT family potassium transporter n=1 Tax=Sediminibacterium sp. TaxID=1917865 RepID=UPI000BD22357|nr:KUP/HAK/KT family potassium transporter [Sediminibacterium sp.]OYY11998.1 MAG: potassium transporter Kup [Sphingobacteriia bacterium 35-36-14]OYZ55035.1 MAG: potassium transporter Kup [Sphingobacteriia bacterium 24-36-13]OZA66437.1 MAG: potassium transporter Kup [Sphingobacteriia bacterium 39-36-14]MDP2422093.1 KUP/HAK/KT family potassium transporter [Sediminibacterium sp.]HQS23024.1 KUP/HAK/KT family potassium transporter [Sediminibacterium sp.]